jgi:hypothetical protein
MKKEVLINLFLLIIITNSYTYAQQLAFPGAEGFGKYSQGGRGGIVIYVTNLDDSGPGSLRDALTSSAYKGKKRTIVFSVSGNIELKSVIEIKYDSYITIAGQTAPGDGICIKNFPIKVGDSHDIIIRYIRFRIGDEQDCGTGCDEIDALSFRKCYNIIVDHCSLSWSIDDVLDLTVSTGYSTIQWCMLYEPLNNSKHPKGAHGYIAGWDGSSYGGGSIFGGGTYHHNLLAHGASRTPRLDKYAGDNGERDLIDITNNVIYNWSGYGAYGGEAADVNWQNNYYKYGPNTSNRYQIFLPGDTCRMYVNGNYVDGYPNITADNSKGISASALLTVSQIIQPKPYNVWFIEMQSPEDAYNSILCHAGANIPQRDTCDKRIINDVINRTGKIIDSQKQVGGWPSLKSANSPVDTDKDGMPDVWEDSKGLNKNDATDRNQIAANGYTQLENYLNSIEFQKPVTNINYKFAENGKIKIKWDDIYIGEDSFRIERSINNSDFEFIANVPKNTNFYTDLTASQFQTIKYKVIGIQSNITKSTTGKYIEATGIVLKSADTIKTGDTIQIETKIIPENSTNQLIKWDLIQDDQIAELSQTGILTAKTTGKVIVKVTLMDGSNINDSKQIIITSKLSSYKEKNSNYKNLIDISPNPSYNGDLYIKLSSQLSLPANLKIYDITGRELHKTIIDKSNFEKINYKFSEGLYIIHINLKEYNFVDKVLVK